MLRTKSYCRAKCAEHLKNAGIDAELFMDGKTSGKYLGWFYELDSNTYWLTRLFRDANNNEVIISKQYAEAIA